MRQILPLVAAMLAAADPPTPAPLTAGGTTTGPTTTVGGVRVAQVAGTTPSWDLRGVASAGWDTNAILDSNPDDTTAGTAVYTTEAALGWRPISDDGRYVRLGLSAAYDRRPHIEALDTARIGISALGVRKAGDLIHSASVTATRYTLDQQGAAAELRGGVSLSAMRPASADIGSLELAIVHYDAAGSRPDGAAGWTGFGDADDRSGATLAGAWRHWWIATDRSRCEAGVRVGRNQAGSSGESYVLAQPQVAALLRPDQGRWQVHGRLMLELRDYDGTRAGADEAERQTTLSAQASVDRRLAAQWLVGAFAGAAHRASNVDDRDYSRWQVALRLTYQLSAED